MDELIKALQIFQRYDNPKYPTHCEHDVLYVLIKPAIVSAEDKAELEKLGFLAGEGDEEEIFISYRFGSA